MPRLDPAAQNLDIGRPQAGQSQTEYARTLNVNQSTISRLWNIFKQSGSSNYRPRDVRHPIATPGQVRYNQVFHLRNRTVSYQPLQSEYLDCEESARTQSNTGFESMVINSEGYISERYWRRYTEVKESVGESDFEIYVTEYGTALTTILPILFLYLNTVTVTAGTFEP